MNELTNPAKIQTPCCFQHMVTLLYSLSDKFGSCLSAILFTVCSKCNMDMGWIAGTETLITVPLYLHPEILPWEWHLFCLTRYPCFCCKYKHTCTYNTHMHNSTGRIMGQKSTTSEVLCLLVCFFLPMIIFHISTLKFLNFHCNCFISAEICSYTFRGGNIQGWKWQWQNIQSWGWWLGVIFVVLCETTTIKQSIQCTLIASLLPY